MQCLIVAKRPIRIKKQISIVIICQISKFLSVEKYWDFICLYLVYCCVEQCDTVSSMWVAGKHLFIQTEKNI